MSITPPETPLEPLPLEPVFVERVWGGTGLKDHFGKELPPGRPIGESWEAADLGDCRSRIAGGAHAGSTLRELIESFGDELTGGAVLGDGRLPLLFKLIDAREDLSVQVHPGDDELPAGSDARGKEEAWYILAADHGARLVHGLAPGVTADDLFAAVAAGRAEDCLDWHEVSPGDVYYVPSGTVHAIGKGIVLAEIQQSSETTYRLYDWGRLGLDGKPRALHIEEARQVTLAAPVPCPYGPRKRGEGPGAPELLVEAGHFRLWRYDLARGAAAAGSLAGRFAILFTIRGSAVLETPGGGRTILPRGKTWLLPATTGAWRVQAADSWEGLWMEPAPGA